jgi:hypothetical protein
MNVPILKPYISATTNPKWMKLVPRERPWPRVSYDCREIPPLPADFDELTNRITAAVKSVTEDNLRRVWDEFSYRVDVVRAAGGGHMGKGKGTP